mmetsp:Transcript_59148/g.153776  ORF Transcript_59148/g.153776 Transcript_59148/m.153776 type:complete len:203 (+) Transcript_59148:163-771(+)
MSSARLPFVGHSATKASILFCFSCSSFSKPATFSCSAEFSAVSFVISVLNANSACSVFCEDKSSEASSRHCISKSRLRGPQSSTKAWKSRPCGEASEMLACNSRILSWSCSPGMDISRLNPSRPRTKSSFGFRMSHIRSRSSIREPSPPFSRTSSVSSTSMSCSFSSSGLNILFAPGDMRFISTRCSLCCLQKMPYPAEHLK